MPKAARGVIYMIWGTDPKYAQALERSRRSLAAVHPELPVEVLRINEPDPYQGMRAKARMLALSPFEETLFLDLDTVVFGRLDFAFAKAGRFGIACCINECPWARRYHQSIAGDVIEYNTGVVFFTEKAKPVFERWETLVAELDAGSWVVRDGKIVGTQPFNDQCAFAAAVERTGFAPFVLPVNWNFRPAWQRSFFGPIRIWHDYLDPPPSFRAIAQYYEDARSLIQYVAADMKAPSSR